MNHTKQTDLQIVSRLMHDLDSLIVPGQHDLQHAIMLALSALAKNIKQQTETDRGLVSRHPATRTTTPPDSTQPQNVVQYQ